MRLFSAILALLAIVAAVEAPTAVADQEDAVPDSDAALVDTILAQWDARSSRFRSGDFVWRVVRRLRSPTLGAVRGSGDPPELIRLRFDGDRFRLDGECAPSVGLSERAWAAQGGASERERFLAALRSHFSNSDSADLEHLGRKQPYAVTVDAVREVHTWAGVPAAEDEERDQGGEPTSQSPSMQGRGRATFSYPRAIVFATGSATHVMGEDSMSAIPLYSALIDALRIGLRPRSAIQGGRTLEPEVASQSNPRSSAKRFHVLPDRPVVNGVKCLVVEEMTDAGGGGETRRIWVDPSRENVIVRCTRARSSQADGPQYEIEYDRGEANVWLPSRVSVLLMSSYGDPHDEISLVRESVAFGGEASIGSDRAAAASERESSSQVGHAGMTSAQPGPAVSTIAPSEPPFSELFAWEPEPGMWVDDRLENRQFFVRDDGTRREITFDENFAGITYADLMDGRSRRAAPERGLRRSRGLAWVAYRAITWPWILVALPAAFLSWFAARAGYSWARGARHRGNDN